MSYGINLVPTITKAPTDFNGFLATAGLGMPRERAFFFGGLAAVISYATKCPQCLYEADGSLARYRGEMDIDDDEEPKLGLKPDFLLAPLAGAIFGYYFL